MMKRKLGRPRKAVRKPNHGASAWRKAEVKAEVGTSHQHRVMWAHEYLTEIFNDEETPINIIHDSLGRLLANIVEMRDQLEEEMGHNEERGLS